MIFVTVGNANQPFDRLLSGIISLIHKGEISSDAVILQIGHSCSVQENSIHTVPFFPLSEFERLIAEAELVVTHAGAGVLMHLFRLKKIPIVMPRRKHYAEHVDDHQFELVQALASEGRVIPAYEPENLSEAIHKAQLKKGYFPERPGSVALQLVSEAITKLHDNLGTKRLPW